MSSGQALTDENRLPWLQRLSASAVVKRKSGAVIMSCSALKRSYRDIIRRHIADVKFIHLKGGADYIEELMASRSGHFMALSLLQSQFDSLESLGSDEAGITVSIETGISAVQEQIDIFILKDSYFMVENVKGNK